jgi:hypothetical protein
MTRDTRELAWAAGLFEGEGWFGLTTKARHVRPIAKAAVSSSDRDVMDRFAAAVGFGNVTGPYQQTGFGTKPMFRWGVGSFQRVQALTALLWFGLGERRRARAIEVLTTCEGGAKR